MGARMVSLRRLSVQFEQPEFAATLAVERRFNCSGAKLGFVRNFALDTPGATS
jgi:hypothetical protein